MWWLWRRNWMSREVIHLKWIGRASTSRRATSGVTLPMACWRDEILKITEAVASHLCSFFYSRLAIYRTRATGKAVLPRMGPFPRPVGTRRRGAIREIRGRGKAHKATTWNFVLILTLVFELEYTQHLVTYVLTNSHFDKTINISKNIIFSMLTH